MTTLQIGTVILAGLTAFLVYVAYDMRRAIREALSTVGAQVLLLETRRADGGPGQAAADSETGATDFRDDWHLEVGRTAYGAREPGISSLEGLSELVARAEGRDE